MKPAWQTSEFWVALATNIVGVIALMGYLSQDQANAIVDAVSRVSGALLSLATTFGWIRARIMLRREVVAALAQVIAIGNPADEEASVRTARMEGLQKAIQDAGV